MRDSYNCTILYYLAGRPSPSISEARCACVSMVRSSMPYVVLYANTGEQPRNNEQECIYLCWPQSNASPSANDMSTKLYLNTLCRGFCTSVLFIIKCTCSIGVYIFKKYRIGPRTIITHAHRVPLMCVFFCSTHAYNNVFLRYNKNTIKKRNNKKTQLNQTMPSTVAEQAGCRLTQSEAFHFQRVIAKHWNRCPAN